ncbi:apoptosis antagonizing transcription factor-domain-containing protein [Syncephalastrum racemosum]|uniref:Protein BFR2 n=1 Tax=Syncephalastrum racemosum TaxID=13706 RepID=A0A1X2HI88_SYNRA|nr:apoptosis antagonizing transcription factor-domain-containing protein [Syncephalastrum racemosum]
MASKRSLADQIADLETTAPKDYDPEDIHEPLNDRDLDTSYNEEEEEASREHYVKVGKSSLRNQQAFLLDDPRYEGKKASRQDLYSSDEDDNDNDNDDDIAVPSDSDDNDNDKDDDDDDDEIPYDDEQQDDSHAQVSGSESDEQDNQSSDEDIEEESEDEGKEKEEVDEHVQDELRRIQEEEKSMMAKMSQSAQADVEKGQHVREQLSLWEKFLESRIRIQKAMEIANQLPQHTVWTQYADDKQIDKDLRSARRELQETMDELIDLRTGLLAEIDAVETVDIDFNSRKRSLEDDDAYVDALWEDISQINDVFLPFRDSTLEKWSNKVQAASGSTKKFKAFDQNVVTQISNILSDKQGLVRRTQLQRAEYKILGKPEIAEAEDSEEQLNGQKVDHHLSNYDVEIFDDNDFYQQQLRELIEARMVDSDDPIAMGVRWAARKSAEVKKKKKQQGDKSSKGRKLK